MSGGNLEHDPILHRLMGPGGDFEVVTIEEDGVTKRIFSEAPRSLGEFINQGRAHGDTTFIVEDGRRISFADYFRQVDTLAAHIAGREDCKPGEVVALAMRNSAAWMIAFSAVVLAGRIPALINSRGLGPSVLAEVEDGGASLLIADEKRLDALRAEHCELPAICSDPSAPRSDALDLADILSRPAVAPPLIPTSPGDIALLFYTSGTTGRAKAAAISHRAIIIGTMNTVLARAAIFHRMAEAYGVDVAMLQANLPQASSLLIFPLFHTSGCASLFLASLATAGKLVLMQRWTASEAFRLVEAEKVTAMTAVPTMLWDILNAPDREAYDLSSLSAFSSGGQALPVTLLNSLREVFPKAMIGSGYGMTESSGAVSQATGEEFLARPESAGRVLPMVDLKAVDGDGRDLPAGEVGELWVRGANLMNGYCLKGEMSDPFQPGGWFATGDVGRVDADGYVYIVDRKTDMVISGGENIYCAEVEQALEGVEGVSELAAFGIPHDRLGECVVLAVVSQRPGAEVKAELAARASETLPGHKRPLEIMVVTEPFPRNAMHKVRKQSLRERMLSQKQGATV